MFVVHFCPPGSWYGFRDPIKSGSGYRSTTLPLTPMTAAARIFNTEEPAAILHHILSSGKYFLAFYAPSKAAEAVRRQAAAAAAGEEGAGGPPAPSPHFVDVFERGSRSRQNSHEAIWTVSWFIASFSAWCWIRIRFRTVPRFIMTKFVKNL